ncbi:hypothetical protein LB533_03535 [Mesorhizobium sp. BR1-1-13]|uniref:hypothetical protein n=1 Tax=Mesorhizobium sp. BR1-1-13 TaxID=2876656 RepID=UPI001CD08D60|nr:hypothetical protein [Mesorhizobium sp. BR1-1-13]MBZ9940172.1 hypothetical protein [Mesorhizobium sp. BR1-1-13]
MAAFKFRIVLFLLPLLLPFRVSSAHADFFEKYAGTAFQVTSRYCSKYSCGDTATFIISVTANGIATRGYPTQFKGRVNKQKDYINEIHSLGDDGFEISTYASSGEKFESFTRYRFSGGKCSVTFSSNQLTGNVSCKILQKPKKVEQTKDNPKACRAIMEVKAEIEALIRKEKAQGPCDVRTLPISQRITKLSTGIKGAGCASKVIEIDGVLKTRGPTCSDLYQREHTPSGDGGVRG